MKRLAPLVLAVALIWALAAVASAPVGTAGAPVAAPDARPNILLVMTDDQTFESIASMPYIRALADRGTKFTNYHASFPLCCPSRATTLTGQYAHHHGVWRNGGPEGGYTAFEPGAGNSLSVWLQDAGYKTMMVGKFLNGYDVGDGVPPGWDRWRVWNRSTDGNSRYHDVPLVYEDGTVHQTTGYSTLTYRKQATQLVDESADGQPWFMWLAFNAPHSSMDADPDDLPQRPSPSPAVRDRDAFEGTKAPAFGRALFNEADVSDKPRFLATLPKMSPAMVRAVNESYSQQLETLQSVDRAIGGIEARLAATGQLGNTVIAFTSDNGLYYGEHRIAAGKNSAYTASSRLPLVVAGPGFGSAVVDGSPRLNTDLAPTFLDLASATPGRAMDGVSLRRSVPAKRPLLFEGRMPFSSGGVPYNVEQYSAIRRPHWFYARYGFTDGTVGVELYDLVADRDMLRNLHRNPAYNEREQALRRAMEAMAGYVVSRRSVTQD